MKLYTYFRSSAAYRVRIALNLKGIECELVPVNLLHSEQKSDHYMALNPQGLIPALVLDDGRVISQSTAILEWLEEQYPEILLYPTDSIARARVRSICQGIACDIHPLDNLRVLKYLVHELGVDEDAKLRWYRHWIEVGFAALEKQLGDGPYCFGENISMADVYLVPQVYNANRFDVDLSPFPKIAAVYEACNQLQAFRDASPQAQPDAV